MTEFELDEQAALDAREPAWRAQGYNVVRQPRPSVLPEFFKGLRPDAVLLGRTPQIIVEVVRKGQPNLDAKLKHLRALLAEHQEWRLEVLYAGEHHAELPNVANDALRETLDSVRNVAAVDPRSSLLLLWAALEAIGRRLEPDRTKRPQSPGTIVELMAGQGFVTPSEAETLRQAVKWRNRLIHGDLAIEVTSEQIDEVSRIAEGLFRAVEAIRAE